MRVTGAVHSLLVAVPAPVPIEPLCPACVARPQAPEGTRGHSKGLCETCAIEAADANAAERDHHDAQARIDEWAARTAAVQRAAWARRQDRSRLLRRVRPREPVPAHLDPLIIAEEALELLTTLNALLPPESRRRLDTIAERVRWLAWGPDTAARG